MDAATHLAGAVSPDLAHIAAEVIDAGMNERRKSASEISDTQPVTGFPSLASVKRSTRVIPGQTRT